MGYKMKGFKGFKDSPMKVSDMEVVSAQRRLNKIQGSYRAPGWQKAAVSISKPFSKESGKSDVAEDIYDRPAAGGAAASGGGEQKKSVGQIASEVKQGIGDVKGYAGELKDIKTSFGALFKGSKNIDTSGGGGGTSDSGGGAFDPNKRTITNLSGQ